MVSQPVRDFALIKTESLRQQTEQIAMTATRGPINPIASPAGRSRRFGELLVAHIGRVPDDQPRGCRDNRLLAGIFGLLPHPMNSRKLGWRRWCPDAWNLVFSNSKIESHVIPERYTA